MAGAWGVGAIEPAAAVAAFTARGDLLPSYAWQDVFQHEHARGLAVAGVSRLDVLQAFQQELALTVKEGRSLRDFAGRIQPRLAAAGFWGDVEVTDPATGETRTTRFDMSRLRLIMDVNLRQSHAAGRWSSVQRTKARMPYLVYLTMHDERVRHSHRQWDYLTLPVDDPWWNTHTPPNGWRCRCTFRAANQAGVDALRAAGKPVKTEAPPIDWQTWINPRTGEVVPVPAGIDPGFAYNPGKEQDVAFWDQALRKAAAAHPVAGAVAVAQVEADRSLFISESTRAFGQWVDEVTARAKPRGELRFVGALRPAAMRALSEGRVPPASAAVAVRDGDVLHALRETKVAAGVAVDASVYRRLPELLERAQAVLLEQVDTTSAVLYVVDLDSDNGQVAKLVVRVDMPIRTTLDGQRVKRVPVNLVRTATVMDPNALLDSGQYRLVWGRL